LKERELDDMNELNFNLNDLNDLPTKPYSSNNYFMPIEENISNSNIVEKSHLHSQTPSKHNKSFTKLNVKPITLFNTPAKRSVRLNVSTPSTPSKSLARGGGGGGHKESDDDKMEIESQNEDELKSDDENEADKKKKDVKNNWLKTIRTEKKKDKHSLLLNLLK